MYSSINQFNLKSQRARRYQRPPQLVRGLRHHQRTRASPWFRKHVCAHKPYCIDRTKIIRVKVRILCFGREHIRSSPTRVKLKCRVQRVQRLHGPIAFSTSGPDVLVSCAQKYFGLSCMGTCSTVTPNLTSPRLKPQYYGRVGR